MNPIQRQLLLEQRRMGAARGWPKATGLRDEPIHRVEVPRWGWARIDSNDGGGAYKITELWWNPSLGEWTPATAPMGLANADARDYMGNSSAGADGIARFWEHRCFQGETRVFIDVNSGWDAAMRISAFTVHYSGTDTTDIFHTVPNCRNGMLEVCIDARRCSAHGSAGDHPGYTTMDETGGFVGYSWGNTLATWSGRQAWWDLEYTAYDADGNWEGSSTQSITGFRIQCRITTEGEMQFRIHNPAAAFVSAVIACAIRLTHYPEPPGTIEVGNCCCHEHPCADSWGDGEWSL